MDLLQLLQNKIPLCMHVQIDKKDITNQLQQYMPFGAFEGWKVKFVKLI